jgi:hypothetical protein
MLARVRLLEHSPERFVGLLSCRDVGSKAELGLCLIPCPLQPTVSSRPVYCVDCQHIKRIIPMPELNLRPGSSFKWEEIYILHRPSPGTDAAIKAPRISAGVVLSAPFRLLELRKLLRRDEYFLRLVSQTQLPDSAESSSTLSLRFMLAAVPISGLIALPLSKSSYITIHLGRCAKLGQHRPPRPGTDGPHWAYIEVLEPPDSEPSGASLLSPVPSHQCSEHHIRDWPLRAKAFDLPGRLASDAKLLSLRLLFTPCPMNPSETLVVHLLPHTSPEWVYTQDRARKETIHEAGLFHRELLNARTRSRETDSECGEYQRQVAAFRFVVKDVSCAATTLF